MRRFVQVAVVILFSVFTSIEANIPPLTSKVEKSGEPIRKFYKISPQYDSVPVAAKKIAILGGAFQGMETEQMKKLRGNKPGLRYMPESTRVIETAVDDEDRIDFSDAHDRAVAQVAWAMTGMNEEGPEFFLINAQEPSTFQKAVWIAEGKNPNGLNPTGWKADIIICSRNWPTYGNNDDKGFINKLVDEAADEGILWFQAAGNDGGKVYNGTIESRRSEKGRFLWFGKERGWFLRFKSHSDENPVTITASWNDFAPGVETHGTKFDLDLYLYHFKKDEKRGRLTRIFQDQGAKKQIVGEGIKGNESLFPMEVMSKLMLQDSGDEDYLIAVKDNSDNFDPGKHRLRITITSKDPLFQDTDKKKEIDPIEFIDATYDGETGNPANSRSAITTGIIDKISSKGPTADGRGKPDILLERSNVSFTHHRGLLPSSSIANAMVGGIAAVLLAAEPNATRRHFLQMTSWIAKHSLEADDWKLDMKDIPERYKPLVEQLSSEMGERVRAFKQFKDGHAVAAVMKQPSSLELFSKVVPSEVIEKAKDYAFFLQSNQSGRTLACWKQNDTEKQQYDPPWKTNGRNDDPSDYLEIAPLQIPKTEDKGEVFDGSDKRPKVLYVPSPEKWTEIVTGKISKNKESETSSQPKPTTPAVKSSIPDGYTELEPEKKGSR